MDGILTPFVEELKKLGQDDGIYFNVHGGMVHLRGALLAVVQTLQQLTYWVS